MSQKHVAEIERLLKIAEDELSYVQKQRQFLLDQIASLKRERENLLQPMFGELPAHYPAGCITSQSSEGSFRRGPQYGEHLSPAEPRDHASQKSRDEAGECLGLK